MYKTLYLNKKSKKNPNKFYTNLEYIFKWQGWLVLEIFFQNWFKTPKIYYCMFKNYRKILMYFSLCLLIVFYV